MNEEDEEYTELETSYETLKSFLSSDLLEEIDNPFNESEVMREKKRRRTTENKRKKRYSFEIREGDWTCFDCHNLNFSFRIKLLFPTADECSLASLFYLVLFVIHNF